MLWLWFGVFIFTMYLLWRNYLSQTRRLREYGSRIPGPKPLPIIGNVLDIGFTTKSFFRILKWIIKDYGPVVRIWIGPKLTILLADPPTIELVLGNSKNLNKSSLYWFAEPWLGQGLLTSKVEIWKKHRRIIAPTFQGHLLTKFVPVFNSNLEVLVEKLSHHQNGPDFDICPYFSLFVLDTVCETAMGLKVNAQLESCSDYVKAVNCLESILMLRAFKPWLYPDILFSLSSLGRQQHKYLSIVLNTTKQVINERRQKRYTESNTKDQDGNEEAEETGIKKKKVFLDYLLDYMEKGEQLSIQELEDEVNTIMFAGLVTTAISLSYTCWLLAKHPHIQEKAAEEVETVFGDSMRDCTPQDLTELKYVEQVIKESLRILPPVVAFARKLSEDVKTDKYILPAGSEATVNVYMLHRHPDYFPDPEKFDPDRFLPENCAGRHPYCYLPFSGGLRNCVGNKYAIQQMKTTMAQILRHFKILPSENPFQDLDLVAQITSKPRNGVRIRLEPRRKQTITFMSHLSHYLQSSNNV